MGWSFELESRKCTEEEKEAYRVKQEQPYIFISRLNKTYKSNSDVIALSDINLVIERGTAVGLIGPNGAGKSTLIKILSGIMRPTSGVIEVDGRVPYKERKAHVASIGVVFGQKTQLWWDLPISRSFDLLRDIYRVPRQRFVQTRDRLVESLKLESFLERPVRQLSLGQRMRAEFAAALLHEPALLILDEPTIGLDAPSKIAVRGFVRDLQRDQGVTILLTTHDMLDVEEIVERIVLIGRGKILADGRLVDLRKRFSFERQLDVDFFATAPDRILPDGIVLLAKTENRLSVAFDPNKHSPTDVIALVAGQHQIADMRLQPRSIEDFVTALYEKHGALEQ
ncbi:ATP-binding cassette domain-containing protein [Agrobacterium rhizogenes]|nr:ATP-binding cassette domain-containing protein [Rhizobium rhizogenes]